MADLNISVLFCWNHLHFLVILSYILHLSPRLPTCLETPSSLEFVISYQTVTAGILRNIISANQSYMLHDFAFCEQFDKQGMGPITVFGLAVRMLGENFVTLHCGYYPNVVILHWVIAGTSREAAVIGGI